MPPGRPDINACDEAGFTIVEALVAGMLLLLAMTATFGVLNSTGRAGADQRQRSQAYDIAQQDQARMRSLKISELATLSETRTVTQGGTDYMVTSTGQFVSDATGTVSCEAGTAAADYINITSSVNWSSGRGHPPTVIASVVAPPNGSLEPDHGALAVAVRDDQGGPVAGFPVSGSGPGSFSGQTGANGCVIFPNQPEGNYTLTPSTASGLVDKDGEPPEPLTTSVVGQSTNTVALLLDHPGTLAITFTTRVGTSVQTTAGDTVTVFNTGMTQAKSFGTAGTTQTTLPATPLFPFASPDTAYAGSCPSNDPTPGGSSSAPAMASVVVAPNGTSNAEIQLPALALRVRKGNSGGANVAGAAVEITDTQCEVGGANVTRSYTTNSSGALPAPGMPYSTYDVCASASFSGGVVRHNTATSVPVKSTASNSSQTIYLGAGAAGIQSGPCP